MTREAASGWDQPGDDGVLDDADTLASDDMNRDRLDAGIDPPGAYSPAEGWGNTEAEARQGESLDQLLAEEEPEQGGADRPTTREDPESGQLIADRPDTATELPANLPDDERSAEQAAVRVEGGPQAPRPGSG